MDEVDEIVRTRPKQKSGYPSLTPQRKEVSARERGKNFLARLWPQEVAKHQAESKSIRFPVASDRTRPKTQRARETKRKSRSLRFPVESDRSSEENSDGGQYETRSNSFNYADEARRRSGADSREVRSGNSTRSSTLKAGDSHRRDRTGRFPIDSDGNSEEQRPRSRSDSYRTETKVRRSSGAGTGGRAKMSRDRDPSTHYDPERVDSPGVSTEERDRVIEGLGNPNRTRSSTTKTRNEQRRDRAAKFQVEIESSDDNRARYGHSYGERNTEDGMRRGAEHDRRRSRNSTNPRLKSQQDDAIRYIYRPRADAEVPIPPPKTTSRDYYEPSSRSSKQRGVRPEAKLPRRDNDYSQSLQAQQEDAIRYMIKSRAKAAPATSRDNYEPSSRSSAQQDNRPKPMTRRSSARPVERADPVECETDLPRTYRPSERSPPQSPYLSRSATIPNVPVSGTEQSGRETKNYQSPLGFRDELYRESESDVGDRPVRKAKSRIEQPRQGTKVYHHSLSARRNINGPKPPGSPSPNSDHSGAASSLCHVFSTASATPSLVEEAESEGARSPKRDASHPSRRTPMQSEAVASDNGDELQFDPRDAEATLKPLLYQGKVEASISSPTTPILSHTQLNDPEAYGWYKAHLVLGPTDEDILVATNPLGHGSLGVVDEVCHKGGRYPTFVRKRIKLPVQKRKAATYLNIAKEEARILGSLVHPHIVALVGSYEDMKQSRSPSYCLLMAPVGENDLETFLAIVGEYDIASEFSIRWRACIRNWMACLASALKYMHASGIRHQDIKPSNIIHKGDQVFFTDFSSSSTFKIGHTTSTENPARSTPMYGAAEVTSDKGRHGQTTDVFALGCVFSDMLSVADGQTVSDFQEFLCNSGERPAAESRDNRQGLSYNEKVPVMSEWFAGSHLFDACISRMLHADRNARPRAAEVLQILMTNECDNRSCLCLRAEVLQMDVDASSVVSVD